MILKHLGMYKHVRSPLISLSNLPMLFNYKEGKYCDLMVKSVLKGTSLTAFDVPEEIHDTAIHEHITQMRPDLKDFSA
jgi:hypothetical protein